MAAITLEAAALVSEGPCLTFLGPRGWCSTSELLELKSLAHHRKNILLPANKMHPHWGCSLPRAWDFSSSRGWNIGFPCGIFPLWQDNLGRKRRAEQWAERPWEKGVRWQRRRQFSLSIHSLTHQTVPEIALSETWSWKREDTESLKLGHKMPPRGKQSREPS